MFKNKKIALAISLTLTMVVALAGCGSKSSSVDASKKEQVIKIGTSGGYFPFTFMNEKDELTGFEIDVWNEIGKRIGYKPEFASGKFSGLFGMLDLGKIDTISNQISITQQRKEKYLFRCSSNS